MFIDTEETGSRITLEGNSEGSEYEIYQERKTNHVNEVESTLEKPKYDGNILHKDFDCSLEEKRSVYHSEITKLQSEKSDKSMSEDRQQINKSYEMSVELSQVRKHTLFGIKRLCCAVM